MAACADTFLSICRLNDGIKNHFIDPFIDNVVRKQADSTHLALAYDSIEA
jgi:hypothetical protein